MAVKASDIVYVPAVELLRLCQIGYSSNTVESKAAADSVYSLLVLNLKHSNIIVPKDMLPYYRKLYQLNQG